MDARCARAIVVRQHLIALNFHPDDVFFEATRVANFGNRLCIMTTVRESPEHEPSFVYVAGEVQPGEDAAAVLAAAQAVWNASSQEERSGLIDKVGIDRIGLVATLAGKGLTPWLTTTRHAV